MNNFRKLPVGIQDFEDLRTNGYLYVDKTAHIYRLSTTGKHYFLSRPRRFGKSLLVSTLKAYFLGKKELFEGLSITELEKEWLEYPVFHIDMNVEGYINLNSLYSALNTNLSMVEEKWGKSESNETPAARFFNLIRSACEQSGRKVVVLIDEYDKPLLGVKDDLTDINNEIRKVLKGFYGVLKSADPYLRFVLLTGVTKFSKVSVFSDLNHLTDISLDRKYAGICGISETELTDCFEPEINALAIELDKPYDETLYRLKKRYNGYHFAKNTEGIYNPFSLLRTFAAGDLRYYWFETGTPTFLVRMLKNFDFDVQKLEKDVRISSNAISEYRVEGADPVPLLYQTGYLTIKDYDSILDDYILGFPNEEVKYGFLNELLPVYMPKIEGMYEFHTGRFIQDLQAGNVESFMTRLKAFFANIPYELNNKTEKDYQTVFYLLFMLMGQFVEAESRSAKGRADAVVKTADTVYVFEFKLTENGTAEDALKQIDDTGYLIPFTASDKKLVKIGAEFSTEERGVRRWIVAEDKFLHLFRTKPAPAILNNKMNSSYG
jgi:hypothetical protein